LGTGLSSSGCCPGLGGRGVAGPRRSRGAARQSGVEAAARVGGGTWRGGKGALGSAAFKERKAEDLGVGAGKESRGGFGRRSRRGCGEALRALGKEALTCGAAASARGERSGVRGPGGSEDECEVRRAAARG
jgi:hypothetical protein